MRKWLDKGKELLKKFEDDHIKPIKLGNKADQNINNVLVPPKCEGNKSDELLQKSLDNENMALIGKLLQQSDPPLSKDDLMKMQQSIFYRKQSSFNSINAQLSQSLSHEIDFSSPGFQNLLKEESKEGGNNNNLIQALFFIGVVGFHHKKGSIVEFLHPSSHDQIDQKSLKFILDSLPIYCMPDAVHNKNEDYVYFTLILPSGDVPQILYGVSYFKQIKVTETMKKNDAELTRSHLQKSVFVLSSVPLQGYIMGRLEPTTKVFFEQQDIHDFSMLQSAYENMNQSLSNNQNIQESEIFIGTSLKSLIHFFREKVLVILKALLLQKKILVFSLHSCATSNFIMSLLSLVPGLSFFRFHSKHVDAISKGLREYGLPLRIFNEKDSPLELYFTIQGLDKIEKYKGYLVGTTNQLIKSHKKTGAELIVDLDTNTLFIPNETVKLSLSLNSQEKSFMDNIIKTVSKVVSESDKDWKNMEYQQNESSFTGSNDWIRQQFSTYLINMFCELEYMKQRYTEFRKEIDKRIGRNSLLQNSPELTHANDKLNQIEGKRMKGMSGEEKIKTNFENKLDTKSEKDKMKRLFDEKGIFEEDTKQKKISRSGIPNLLEFDSEILMGICADSDSAAEIEAQKIFHSAKERLKISYQSLKAYNSKFLIEFLKSDCYKYWSINHDSSISLRCQNNSELTEKASIVLENGEIYVGSMQYGHRTGNGSTYDQITGRIESCQNYEHDKKNGHGTIGSAKEDYFFEGEFINDIREGFGNLITDKLKYSGMFFHDKFHGQGTLVGKDGSIYEGEFCDGFKSGMGKFTSGTGATTYVGDFADDLFNGKGQLVEKESNNIYSGDFKNNQMHGQGEYSTQKFTYSGEFYQGKLSGQGIYTNLSTSIAYQGEFKDSVIDSSLPCIIKYPNGDVYSGEIDNWLPNGTGLISHHDGRIVSGVFKQGQIISEVVTNNSSNNNNSIAAEKETN